ncbi:MAG: DUF4258 domain-containing protein [Rhizobiaceae bacterium]|nr:DUF4258 domain-containing protein [Rhizobiaceae bacterium]
MSDDNAEPPVAGPPNPKEFLARVRFLAQDTSFISWSRHARERMEERDISIRMAVTVIREGYLKGEVVAGKSQGEWKAKIVRNAKGRRDVGVVVLLFRNDRLLVKTVEWEDVR